MSERKEIGKIQSLKIGYGGYDDAMLGVSFTLGSDGWGVNDFDGTWAHHHKSCKWTPEDQVKHLGKMLLRLRDLMDAAKVKTVAELRGKPVEVTFDGNKLKSWRILTEAI